MPASKRHETLPSLRQMISRYMLRTMLLLLTGLLVLFLYTDLRTEQKHALHTAAETFTQIENLLQRNQGEKNAIEKDYAQDCLQRAESIAYMVSADPHIAQDFSELRKICSLTGVDEIHIIDKNGEIVSGTEPKYYGYTLDSGSQMQFFRPMLENRNLKLVQDIQPNTAEGKLMQYSAVWCKNTDYIVEIGMEPMVVMNATKRTELSYIVSQLSVNPEVLYYAIDRNTYEILGASRSRHTGLNIETLGFDIDKIQHRAGGFHTKVNGLFSYCIFKEYEDLYLGFVMPVKNLYRKIPYDLMLMFAGLSLLSIFFYYFTTRFLQSQVISRIEGINSVLEKIGQGNYTEQIAAQSSLEFSEFCQHIDDMVQSILRNRDKLSYAIRMADMPIAAYEYSRNSQKISFAGDLAGVLCLSKQGANALCDDPTLFRTYLAKLKASIPDADKEVSNTCMIQREGKTRYVRLEEMISEEDVFGVIIDVTENMYRLKQAEADRDTDMLTGLSNRRALEKKMRELLKNPNSRKHCGIIMVDLDNLKKINDQLGHQAGDAYLMQFAQILQKLHSDFCYVARQGGDEFVLLLHDCENQQQMQAVADQLAAQNDHMTEINGNPVRLEYSFGVCFPSDTADTAVFSDMLAEADKNMYLQKQLRKSGRRNLL